jgi:hypothetical protein
MPNGAKPDSLQNVQLLNDGRVVIQTFNGGVRSSDSVLFVLSPDDYGRYETGSYGTPLDLLQRHQAPVKLLRSDGKVVLHGSHYSGDTGFGVYKTYDPVSHTFASVGGLNIDHSGRAGVAILDDGRFYSPYGSTTLVTAASGGIPVSNGISTGFGQAGESGLALVPDGSFEGLPMGQGLGSIVSGLTSRISAYPIISMRPSYASVTVLEGSGPGGTDVVSTTYITGKPEPSIDWAFPNGIWHWQTLDSMVFINPEIGPNIYMPKIGKVVHLGGHAGIISGWKPSDKEGTFGVLATFQPPANVVTGAANRAAVMMTLTSPAVGSLPSVAVSGGSLTATLLADTLASEVPIDIIVCATQDGKYVVFAVSSRTGGTSGTLTAGTSITFSVSGIRFGATSSTLSSQVFFYTPTLSAGETGCAILPSGDLLYPLGHQNVRDGYPTSNASWVRWDGASSSPTSTHPEGASYALANQPSGDVAYFHGYCLLPTGQLLVATAEGVWLYTDDKAPDPAAAPRITRMPTVLDGGKSFKLVGSQLSGIHVGVHWGDDQSGVCNHPLFRLTDISSGLVFFCPTTDYSYRGIQPNRISSCTVTVPSTVPGGLYDAQVITNGVASEKVRVRVVFGTVPGETIEINPFTTGS